MLKSHKNMHIAFPVGMVVTLGSQCLGNPPGSKGVVCENYTLGSHHGVSIIFANGLSDGFSETCIEMFDVVPSRFARHLQNYKFTSIEQLNRDFERGLFIPALTINAAKKKDKP